MRKPRKTVVVAVLLSTVGFLGAGTAYAHGEGHKHGHGQSHGREHHGRESQSIRISQNTTCTTNEENTDVAGESRFGNGLAGNTDSKGSPGTQNTNVGSSLGCNNTITFGK